MDGPLADPFVRPDSSCYGLDFFELHFCRSWKVEKSGKAAKLLLHPLQEPDQRGQELPAGRETYGPVQEG